MERRARWESERDGEDAAARVDGWFEGIWGFPESSRTREPTRAALHVALLVLISGLDSPVALRRAPLVLPPSPLYLYLYLSLSPPSHRSGARIFCLAAARWWYTHTCGRARARKEREREREHTTAQHRCAIGATTRAASLPSDGVRCAARPLRGRRGAYRPIVTPPRDSAAAYHALSRRR